MKELTLLSITQMAKGLRARDFSSSELIESHLRAIDKDPYNAFITITADLARSQAKIADEILRSKPQEAHVLTGIPIGIKDNFCTKGVLTTAGSQMLHNFVPQYESTVTQKLWHAGAVMVGKTNMDEFAMGSANLHSYYGMVKNPWRRADGSIVVPGGSSGGSAAAVGGYLVAAATGSDTGGSVRQPAAYCGVVGVKPTYGRCSRWGLIAYASSLDQAGILARNVEDAAVMLEAICGYDNKDSTSVNIPASSFEFNQSLKGKRIGVPKKYMVINKAPSYTQEMLDNTFGYLEKEGAEVIEVDLSYLEYSLPTYYVIAPAEAASNLARFDGLRYGLRVEGENLEDTYIKTRTKGFGNEVKMRIAIGNYFLSGDRYLSYFCRAQKLRQLVTNDFTEAFKKVEAIIMPTAIDHAFQSVGEEDALKMYYNDIFTIPANLAGLPAISIPGGLSTERLPLGIQIIGAPFSENNILNIANNLSKNFDITELLIKNWQAGEGN